MSDNSVTFTIHGEPCSKANSRQLVYQGKPGKKRPVFIKSQKALAYETSAMLQIPIHCRAMFEGPVSVTLWIFYLDNRSDLDESLILDVLQARFVGEGKRRKLVRKGVYLNDRQVREKHVYHGIDKADPRVEIIVQPLINERGDYEKAGDAVVSVPMYSRGAGRG